MKSGQRVSEIEFISLIAMLMALVVLPINMILPAFQAMAVHFSLASVNHIGLSVSLLYSGLAIGQIVFGALSDSIGRKSALSIGLVIFLVGALLSYSVDHFVFFLLGQMIQGVGLGAPRIVTMAVVRDLFEGEQMARIMSFVMVIFIFVPMVSPFLGQLITQFSGWRSLYLVFAMAAIAMLVWMKLRLTETLPAADRSPLRIRVLLDNFTVVISNAPSMLHAAALGFVSGAFVSYLNMSQQILQFQYELGTQYPLYFALMSLGIALASFINGHAVLAIGMERMTIWTLVVMFILSGILAGAILFIGSDPSLSIFLSYLLIMLFSFGVLVSNLNSMAMRSLGSTAGMGAAMVGAFSTLVSVPLSIWVGQYYSGSVLPLIMAFGGFASLGFALTLMALKQESRRVPTASH